MLPAVRKNNRRCCQLNILYSSLEIIFFFKFFLALDFLGLFDFVFCFGDEAVFLGDDIGGEFFFFGFFRLGILIFVGRGAGGECECGYGAGEDEMLKFHGQWGWRVNC